MKFGENLKNIRKSKNISQEYLAEKLGVSRQSVSKWETGENFPSMNNIMCLCEIFKCKINDLVHEDFTDIESLDSEIKESVVKFKKEKQIKVKLISKIIYIMANIVNKIFIGVAVLISIIIFALPFIGKSARISGTDLLISNVKVASITTYGELAYEYINNLKNRLCKKFGLSLKIEFQNAFSRMNLILNFLLLLHKKVDETLNRSQWKYIILVQFHFALETNAPY